MNLRVVQRLTAILLYFNWLLVLVVGAIGSKFTVALFTQRGSQGSSEYEIAKREPRNEPGEVEKFTLDNLGICWQTKILSEPPKKALFAPKPKKPRKPVSPGQLPFEYVGCVVHPIAKKSVAILQEKRTGQQILVRYGTLLPGTKYTVVEISPNAVKLEYAETIVILQRHNPWQMVERAEGETQPRESHDSINAAIVGDKDAIVVQGSQELADYGLQKQDKIVGCEKKRVYNLRQLRDILAVTKKQTIRLSLMR
jgi:hypothetical protein